MQIGPLKGNGSLLTDSAMAMEPSYLSLAWTPRRCGSGPGTPRLASPSTVVGMG
jgi:hypothetical protein